MKGLAVLLGIAAMLAGTPGSTAQRKSFKIIVHPDNPVTHLTAKDVSNYLLKKKLRWEGWDRVVHPIDLNASSPTRAAFSRAVHGRSVASIKNYWQRQIFSGREAPPPEVTEDAEVIAHVRSRPGAIGYVSGAAALEGVKEVALTN